MKLSVKFAIACSLSLFCAANGFARGGGGGRGGGASVSRSGSYGSVRQSAAQTRVDSPVRGSYDGVRERPAQLPSERPGLGDGRFGDRVTTLPADYRIVYVRGLPYYYCGGYYYHSYDGDGGGYTIVEPPIGAIIYELPEGATALVVDGVNYFIDGKTYYRTTYSNGQVAYIVVPAPR
jgi:Family of unknown function (DUF6515)